ncbi:MAG TPA: hypothetical protein VFH29_04610 [Anaerolineales bacterium]|nr:hypothetical protein [Anaerolineales bacterium]
MNDPLNSTAERTRTAEAQTAEATLVNQPEDHTRPAGQVFDEQREHNNNVERAISALLIP